MKWLVFLAFYTFFIHQDKSLPLVTTEEEFKVHSDGQKVVLIGSYTIMSLPDSKFMSRSMVNIKLGSFEVLLERDEKEKRSKEEVKKFSGKKVKVIGLIYQNIRPWGNIFPGVMPAIVDIESIERVK